MLNRRSVLNFAWIIGITATLCIPKEALFSDSGQEDVYSVVLSQVNNPVPLTVDVPALKGIVAVEAAPMLACMPKSGDWAAIGKGREKIGDIEKRQRRSRSWEKETNPILNKTDEIFCSNRSRSGVYVENESCPESSLDMDRTLGCSEKALRDLKDDIREAKCGLACKYDKISSSLKDADCALENLSTFRKMIAKIKSMIDAQMATHSRDMAGGVDNYIKAVGGAIPQIQKYNKDMKDTQTMLDNFLKGTSGKGEGGSINAGGVPAETDATNAKVEALNMDNYFTGNGKQTIYRAHQAGYAYQCFYERPMSSTNATATNGKTRKLQDSCGGKSGQGQAQYLACAAGLPKKPTRDKKVIDNYKKIGTDLALLFEEIKTDLPKKPIPLVSSPDDQAGRQAFKEWYDASQLSTAIQSPEAFATRLRSSPRFQKLSEADQNIIINRFNVCWQNAGKLLQSDEGNINSSLKRYDTNQIAMRKTFISGIKGRVEQMNQNLQAATYLAAGDRGFQLNVGGFNVGADGQPITAEEAADKYMALVKFARSMKTGQVESFSSDKEVAAMKSLTVSSKYPAGLVTAPADYFNYVSRIDKVDGTKGIDWKSILGAVQCKGIDSCVLESDHVFNRLNSTLVKLNEVKETKVGAANSNYKTIAKAGAEAMSPFVEAFDKTLNKMKASLGDSYGIDFEEDAGDSAACEPDKSRSGTPSPPAICDSSHAPDLIKSMISPPLKKDKGIQALAAALIKKRDEEVLAENKNLGKLLAQVEAQDSTCKKQDEKQLDEELGNICKTLAGKAAPLSDPSREKLRVAEMGKVEVDYDKAKKAEENAAKVVLSREEDLVEVKKDGDKNMVDEMQKSIDAAKASLDAAKLATQTAYADFSGAYSKFEKDHPLPVGSSPRIDGETMEERCAKRFDQLSKKLLKLKTPGSGKPDPKAEELNNDDNT